MSTPRPAVKRTYGARKTTGTPAASTSTSSPSRSRRTTTTSSAPPSSSPSRLRPHRPTTTSTDWAAAVAESFEEEGATMMSGKGKGKAQDEPEDGQQKEVEKEGRVLRERKTPTKPKGDLRSFFSRQSPKKKRRLSSPVLASSGEEDEDKTAPMSRSSSSSSSGASSVSSVATTVSAFSSSSSSKKPSSSSSSGKLEQLYLDPFSNSGHYTLSCPTCSLSYARTPEDQAFHAKHHRKVVSGVDWTVAVEAKGVSVVEEDVDWGDKSGGRVVVVDWAVAEQATRRKLKDILSTIDTELSSTSLTPSQLDLSKVFLFVTPQRKICAAAVVQRIETAFEIVTSAEKEEEMDEKPDERLLRFGEDQGAIFCSPTPLPTLLGVQRIWTSTSSRRSGLASLLLTHAASKFIYGCPIPLSRRSTDVAFSQPTGKGQKLARQWTGLERFRVFVD